MTRRWERAAEELRAGRGRTSLPWSAPPWWLAALAAVVFTAVLVPELLDATSWWDRAWRLGVLLVVVPVQVRAAVAGRRATRRAG